MSYKSKHTGAQVDEAVSKVLNGEVGGSGATFDKLVNITYLELKSLRDNSKLIPGQQYRITDYVTTTIQSNTRIAEEYHPFDIIVTADDVNVLNEKARVIQHEGDTYFTNSDLNAWELKYCLDNDTERFAWADTTNGKGVIYRMIDEWNNDCPYDFKNIQFKHPNNKTDSNYYYTFSVVSTGGVSDNSLNGGYCYKNKIGFRTTGGKQQPNNIVFINTSKTSPCSRNSFGNGCYDNSFGDSCYGNSFGNSCYKNSFDDSCYGNSFGNTCFNNSFGDSCYGNSFGYSCYKNSFGYTCYKNSFDGHFDNNSFGTNCCNNSFGEECSYNSFGNNCNYNRFGNSCSNNSFGNSCSNNSFGNSCNYNRFGESETNPKSYYRNIIIDNGNRYIKLNCTSTTSSSKYFQNVRIGLGVNNTTEYKTINDSNVGQTYETCYKPTNSQTITV